VVYQPGADSGPRRLRLEPLLCLLLRQLLRGGALRGAPAAGRTARRAGLWQDEDHPLGKVLLALLVAVWLVVVDPRLRDCPPAVAGAAPADGRGRRQLDGSSALAALLGPLGAPQWLGQWLEAVWERARPEAEGAWHADSRCPLHPYAETVAACSAGLPRQLRRLQLDHPERDLWLLYALHGEKGLRALFPDECAAASRNNGQVTWGELLPLLRDCLPPAMLGRFVVALHEAMRRAADESASWEQEFALWPELSAWRPYLQQSFTQLEDSTEYGLVAHAGGLAVAAVAPRAERAARPRTSKRHSLIQLLRGTRQQAPTTPPPLG